MRAPLLSLIAIAASAQDALLNKAERLSLARDYEGLSQLLLQPDAIHRLDAAGRLPALMQTLGSQKPMSERTTQAFRAANQQGYFTSNALLLAANSSPGALKLWESMMLDKTADSNIRIASMHLCLTPNRNAAAILASARNVVARTAEPEIRNAAGQALFAPGTILRRPGDPPLQVADWQSVATPALREALALGESLLQHSPYAALRASIENEVRKVRAVLTGRR